VTGVATTGPLASPAERAAVDAVLGPPAGGWDGGERRPEVDGRVARAGHDRRERRHLLLPSLQALQRRVGWVTPGGLALVCERLAVPKAEAYGVATFYALLAVEERPPTAVHVCQDLACRVNGALELIGALEAEVGSEGTTRGGATWHRSPCLGQCDRGPAALVTVAGEHPVEAVLTQADVPAVVAAMEGRLPAGFPHADVPQRGHRSLRLLARVGRVDPLSLDAYRAEGGFEALRHALRLGPEAVLREVRESELSGRGGASFPTGAKWEAVARHPVRPHYLVCNADESEPGTFKDRVLLEGDPYALVEAMLVAAFATGASRGYVYLRGEYPQAHHALERALGECRRRGFLGFDVLGSGFSFDVEVRLGSGAYICGEETAIFNSIEGFRGEPRSKPPFPADKGLFGMPTVVNNVETLVNVVEILRHGGSAFASTGTGGSTGTKLFCVSGQVVRAGVYEVPFGATLRDVLGLAGGVRGGRPLQAVLLGGAAGTFAGPGDLDVPLTLEGTRAAGLTLGSGVVLVLDDTVDLPALLARIAAFFRDESCGQCVPCRVGTVRQEEVVARLRAGADRRSNLAVLAEVGACMRDASICGLGQTASSAIESAIARLGVFAGGPEGRP
jgi:NADH-quinone oxidoreductase subunit F